jgi:hypothetical protein
MRGYINVHCAAHNGMIAGAMRVRHARAWIDRIVVRGGRLLGADRVWRVNHAHAVAWLARIALAWMRGGSCCRCRITRGRSHCRIMRYALARDHVRAIMFGAGDGRAHPPLGAPWLGAVAAPAFAPARRRAYNFNARQKRFSLPGLASRAFCPAAEALEAKPFAARLNRASAATPTHRAKFLAPATRMFLRRAATFCAAATFQSIS